MPYQVQSVFIPEQEHRTLDAVNNYLTLNLYNVSTGGFVSVTADRDKAIGIVADFVISHMPEFTLSDYALYEGLIQDHKLANIHTVSAVLDIIDRIQ